MNRNKLLKYYLSTAFISLIILGNGCGSSTQSIDKDQLDQRAEKAHRELDRNVK